MARRSRSSAIATASAKPVPEASPIAPSAARSPTGR